jgi:hypothetical protein
MQKVIHHRLFSTVEIGRSRHLDSERRQLPLPDAQR